jgi:Zn-finger nucleic acid-binding protein
MTRLVDVKHPHLWYESCPVCYGVFFDAGEFTDYAEENLLDFFKDWLMKERK